MQLHFRCDALSVFDRDQRADGYTQEQRKLSIKIATMSEGDKFNKQMPTYVAQALDANSMAISYWQVLVIGIHKYIFTSW